MKLETVSKVKGFVALAGISLWVALAPFALAGKHNDGALFYSGLSGLIGIVYAVKWCRLRAYIRRAEHTARTRGVGGY